MLELLRDCIAFAVCVLFVVTATAWAEIISYILGA